LWLALLAVLFITLVYLLMMAVSSGVPAASSLYGHGMGILGFILMVLTETLYTWRKHRRSARWGAMATWLRFHVFTGLVGPYLVLLHTSWKFNGVAGVLMLLLVLVVLSGFVGRYIYTAVPRTADGAELLEGEIERQIGLVEASLGAQLEELPAELGPIRRRLALETGTRGDVDLVFGRTLRDWRERWQWQALRRHLGPGQRERLLRLQDLLHQRSELRRQKASLAVTRQMLAVWHAVHIPIGLGLFSLSLVHIAAAVYYADLMR
jgi:hypothetical protein